MPWNTTRWGSTFTCGIEDCTSISFRVRHTPSGFYLICDECDIGRIPSQVFAELKPSPSSPGSDAGSTEGDR